MFFGSSSGCILHQCRQSHLEPFFRTTTNKLPKIYTANHATFTILVHSWYTRMADFGRREIEYMQALCIYNKYIECYSVGRTVRYHQKTGSGGGENLTHKCMQKNLVKEGKHFLVSPLPLPPPIKRLCSTLFVDTPMIFFCQSFVFYFLTGHLLGTWYSNESFSPFY